MSIYMFRISITIYYKVSSSRLTSYMTSTLYYIKLIHIMNMSSSPISGLRKTYCNCWVFDNVFCLQLLTQETFIM